MEIVTLTGIFGIGIVFGLTTGYRRTSARRRGAAEEADDLSGARGRVNDLLTVLGAPLFHPKEDRALTTEERVEWIQARAG
jgi:hypothetical protein